MVISDAMSQMVEAHVEVVQGRAHYLVLFKDNVHFGLCNIYAPNTVVAKKRFWEELLDMLPSFRSLVCYK
jgi:hypothetical protein